GPAREALGFAGRLAVDRLVRIPDQLALAAAVLALGLGLMMTAATVARSFEQSVLDFIRRQVHADLVVASTATTGCIEAPRAVGARPAGRSSPRWSAWWWTTSRRGAASSSPARPTSAGGGIGRSTAST